MMKRVSVVLIAIACLLASGPADAAGSGSDQQSQPSIEAFTASQMQYMHDQEKLALDLNWEFLEMWDDPVFLTLGASERSHMDTLWALMQVYHVDPLVVTRTEGVYGHTDHTGTYSQLHDRGSASLLEAYLATAYVEEWDIRELRAGLASTNEQSVVNVLQLLLTDAENHLRMLVSRIKGLGHEYQAQMLSQVDVDQICSGVQPYTGTTFTMNGGLNDAWYYPALLAQGFFISVYPDLGTVAVSWMSYDTLDYAPGWNSHLGDASQRWFIAHGKFTGNRAKLEVFSAGGGIFDTVDSYPELESIGSMILQFENCSSGSIWYVLTPLWGGYMMPIERVALDNVGQCELNTQP